MSLRLLGGASTADIDTAVAEAVETHTPGIHAGMADITSTWPTSSTQLIPGLSITVVGTGRPVDVEFFCPRVWNGTTANTYISARIFRNGVQATDGGVFSPVTTAGPSLYVKHAEPTIAVGVSVTFTVQAFLGSAGNHSFYASLASRCYLKAVSR